MLVSEPEKKADKISRKNSASQRISGLEPSKKNLPLKLAIDMLNEIV